MQLTIISGASSGIGKAMAEQAEAAGHTLATISRRPGPGRFLEADLSDPAAWPTVVDWMGGLIGGEPWDRIVFIHNAGVIDPIGFAGAADDDAYTSNILLNGAASVVLGAGFIKSAATLETKSHLMMISSGAGRRAIKGWSSYCAGKAATDMWANTAGIEQDYQHGPVTVTSIAPGVVDTDMQSVIRTQESADFPDIANFLELKESGALSDAATVGETLLALAAIDAGQEFRGVTIENGMLLNISDFAAA